MNYVLLIKKVKHKLLNTSRSIILPTTPDKYNIYVDDNDDKLTMMTTVTAIIVISSTSVMTTHNPGANTFIDQH